MVELDADWNDYVNPGHKVIRANSYADSYRLPSEAVTKRMSRWN